MKGQTSLTTMQLPYQRPRKLEKLSQNTCNPDKLSQSAMQNTLNKKGLQSPTGSEKQSSNKENTGDKQSSNKENA